MINAHYVRQCLKYKKPEKDEFKGYFDDFCKT